MTNENNNISSVNTDEIMPKDNTDMKCAPAKKFSSGSCIDLPVLIEMAKAYNKVNEKPIKLDNRMETLNPKKYKKYLLKQIGNKYKNVCTTQFCWTQQDFVKKMDSLLKEELEKYTYRPDGPSAQFEWLNTIQLNDVMEQYTRLYNDFEFLGAVPIDFQDLPELGISNINIDELKSKGKTKIGIIYNLDNHKQSGSHWVAGYFDTKNGLVYYFDSYGTPPGKEVRSFMRKIAKQIENTDIKVQSTHNKTRHQYGGSECGVYSLNILRRILEHGDNLDIENICKNKLSDEEVNKFRGIFFRNVEIN
jgi:hypothetical protein